MWKRILACLPVCGLAMMGLYGSAHAASVPLSDLINNGGTVQSGDKTFSDFTYQKTGDMPGADDVLVQDIVDQDGNVGIRFFAGFIDLAGGSSSDALITFNVNVPVGSDQLITGAHMAANPAVFDNSTGLASVTETFLPNVDNDKLVVFDFGEGDDKLTDSLSFGLPGFVTLPVQKDLILHTTSDTGAVTMSFIDQTFTQVPEPSAVALLMLGLIGLLGSYRRR